MAKSASPVIHSLFRFGSAVLPRWTGSLAFALFCRPPRSKPVNPRQQEAFDRARKTLLMSEVRHLPFRDGTLCSYFFKQHASSGHPGTVLLLHGWTGQAESLVAFIEPLQALGYNVLLVDLPAHGESSGSTLTLALAVEALHAIHAVYGPWSAIVAHSFGGAVATGFITGAIKGCAPVDVARQVMIASPNAMATVFEDFGRWLGLNARAQAAMNAKVPALAGRPIEELICSELLKRTRTRTFVLHAPDDKEVRFSDAEALARAGDFVTLQALPGLGHRRILQAPETIAAVAGFLTPEQMVLVHARRA